MIRASLKLLAAFGFGVFSLVLFFGAVRIAGSYDWDLSAPVNFGVALGSPVSGQVWLPVVLCVILGSVLLWCTGFFARKAIRTYRAQSTDPKDRSLIL